jgi:hypothetical protein
LQGSLFNGLLNPDLPFTFTCPSGNCTWPDFYTLGLCNSCADVSKATRVTLALGFTVGLAAHSDGGILEDASLAFLSPAGIMLQKSLADWFLGDRNAYLRLPFSTEVSEPYVSLAIFRPGESYDKLEKLWQDIRQVLASNPNSTVLSKFPVINSVPGSFAYDRFNPLPNYTFMDATIANTTVMECKVDWCAKQYKDVSVVRVQLSML